MTVMVVVDALESLDPSLDTSVGLMHAAQDAGHQVWVTRPGDLDVVDARPRALAKAITLTPSEPAGGCRWTVPAPWCRVVATEHVWLDRADAVFMWAEPPVDERYRHATFVLDLLDPARTAVVNDPRGLRVCSEHLLPLQFPDLIASTILTAEPATIRGFVADHDDCVLKPVDGFGGRGVLRLRPDDPNLASLLEISTANGSRPVLVQEYLPQVEGGNKRVFMLDGRPQAAVYRYPLGDDFRIGHPSTPAPVTARDRQICRALAPTLALHGIRVAGLDVIGPYLIEVNITSPGALRKADALLGTRLCAEVLDHVLPSARMTGESA